MKTIFKLLVLIFFSKFSYSQAPFCEERNILKNMLDLHYYEPIDDSSLQKKYYRDRIEKLKELDFTVIEELSRKTIMGKCPFKFEGKTEYAVKLQLETNGDLLYMTINGDIFNSELDYAKITYSRTDKFSSAKNKFVCDKNTLAVFIEKAYSLMPLGRGGLYYNYINLSKITTRD